MGQEIRKIIKGKRLADVAHKGPDSKDLGHWAEQPQPHLLNSHTGVQKQL